MAPNFTNTNGWRKNQTPTASLHIRILPGRELGEDDIPKTASWIEKQIQCELPNPTKEKENYDLIVTQQIHEPCLLGDPRCQET
ncbi:MAG: hypothetical protein EZS28_020754 [Streblomastix strix]|uniref:Uncharacterized protein n=1 Tax=Streblomastix strix TaxID=222440 RepID=A0A5J4VMA4_9EUKA|nr:MAG: hypothetical protein EZS28_020754 [Streblomastix strix]